MNLDDAEKVAEIVSEIDGGCIGCITAAMVELHRYFPEHDWPKLIADAGWSNYGHPETAEAKLRYRLRDY